MFLALWKYSDNYYWSAAFTASNGLDEKFDFSISEIPMKYILKNPHCPREKYFNIQKAKGLVWLAGWFGAFVYFPAEKMKKLCRGGERIIFPNNKKKLQCWLFSGQIEICTFFHLFQTKNKKSESFHLFLSKCRFLAERQHGALMLC